MKIFYKILVYIGMAATLVMACNKESTTVPVSFDSSDIHYTKAPGSIILRWTKPDKPDYKFIEVAYTVENEERVRCASAYSDSLLIDGLLARYGEIDFALTAVSEDGGRAETIHYGATAGPAEKKFVVGDDYDVEIKAIYGDRTEVQEPYLPEHMLDGNPNTYYHSVWSGVYYSYEKQDDGSYKLVKHSGGGKNGCPIYIVADLGDNPQLAFKFSYICRNHPNKNNPEEMTVLGADEFDPTVFGAAPLADGVIKAKELKHFSGLPGDKGAKYSSTLIKADKPYRFLIFRTDKVINGAAWMGIAEFSITGYEYTIIDPEND